MTTMPLVGLGQTAVSRDPWPDSSCYPIGKKKKRIAEHRRQYHDMQGESPCKELRAYTANAIPLVGSRPMSGRVRS